MEFWAACSAALSDAEDYLPVNSTETHHSTSMAFLHGWSAEIPYYMARAELSCDSTGIFSKNMCNSVQRKLRNHPACPHQSKKVQLAGIVLSGHYAQLPSRLGFDSSWCTRLLDAIKASRFAYHRTAAKSHPEFGARPPRRSRPAPPARPSPSPSDLPRLPKACLFWAPRE